MSIITVEVQHAAEIANGRDVFRATGKFVVNGFRCRDAYIQVGVKLGMDGLHSLGSLHKIRISNDKKIDIA